GQARKQRARCSVPKDLPATIRIAASLEWRAVAPRRRSRPPGAAPLNRPNRARASCWSWTGSASVGQRKSVRQLFDVDVLEPQLVAMVLQLNRALCRQRLFALVPVVAQRLVIDHQLVIEVYRRLVAHHDDAERIPFADRFVGVHERIPTGRSFLAVVPESAGTQLGVVLLVRRLLRIPDLHLGLAAEIDAAVAFG